MKPRLRLRYYDDHESIPAKHAAAIKRRLGEPKGPMRTLAEFTNAQCVVAYLGRRPIAWVALIPPRRKHRTPWLHVFVLPRFRRQGIGWRMCYLMVDRAELWNKVCNRSEHNARAVKFFSKFFTS